MAQAEQNRRLNVVADEALRTYRIGKDPVRVDVRSCLVDPLNRNQTLMSGARVHNLLRSILQAGFSEQKAQVGIVLDISPERRPEVLAHNKKVCAGDPLLPNVEEDTALYTVLHTNHFTMIARCFVYQCRTIPENMKLGITSPEGRLSLSLLEHVDQAFYNYVCNGHRVVRLSSRLSSFPSVIDAVVSSSNHDLALRETEVQLLVAACDACKLGDGVPSSSASDGVPEAIQEQMKIRFPHLTWHCRPMVSFAWRFGDGPFVKDLVSFHSEHVQAERCKTEGEFWSALVPIPSEFGWAAVALAKDNWVDEFAKSGVCRGVPLSALGKVVRNVSLLRELNNSLGAWRRLRSELLALLPVKIQAKILGRFDITCSRVAWQGHAKFPTAGGERLRVTSFDDAILCAEHDLAAALETANLKEHIPKDVKDLVGLEMVSKKKRGATEPERPVFDARGEQCNVMQGFLQRGFQVGVEVTVASEIIVQAQRKQVIGEGVTGHVEGVTETSILVRFPEADLVTWAWATFPWEKLFPKRPTSEAILLNSETRPLAAIPNYKTALAKAEMFMALNAWYRQMAVDTSYVTVRNHGPGSYPIAVYVKPKRVVARVTISEAKPLLLVPMTMQFSPGSLGSEAWGVTKHPVSEGAAESLVLGNCFSDPLGEASGKPGVVEPFWCVRRSDKPEECNMELVDTTVTLASIIVVDSIRGPATKGNSVTFPLMKSSRRIESGHELVVLHESAIAAASKKVKTMT